MTAPRVTKAGRRFRGGNGGGRRRQGPDRHASGEPFERQPMIAIAAMVGVEFPLGQAQKKAQEAARFAAAGDVDCARAEILGGINYFAGALIALEGRR